MSIYAPSTERFGWLLRISRSSVAEPPWFAAPVDGEEDEDSVTIVFHVPTKSHGRVRVQANDQNVTVLGGHRAMRLCALPYQLDRDSLESSRSGDLLRVRVPKKRPATDSSETPRPPST